MWLKKFVKENLPFLYPFTAWIFVGAILLLLFSKDILILAVNSRNHAWGDQFFKYYTHVGDGVTCLGVAAFILLFVSKEKGILLSAAYAFSAIPVQIIKNFAFEHNPRPRSFFWLDYDRLHFVDGVEILVSNSFPSGHTAAAFSMFLVFSFWTHKRWLSFVYFILAFLVGYSRMYLAQHFFADVYAGSLIAIIMTSLIIYLFDGKWRLRENPALKGGLLTTL